MANRILLFLILLIAGNNICTALQDENLTITELIEYWGYPVESHETRTEDGYYLTLHRIPRGRFESNTSSTKKTVMFLQHGLLCSSSNWVVNLPHQSLAFILADAGYDVWMGNVRGNKLSKKHDTLNPNGWKFWDFSFDEHGKYDFPAMIDYTLLKTGKKQLFYVGHSQGSMMAFAGLSENKELQKKIKVFFALAPVARLQHMYGPLEFMTHFEMGFKLLFKVFRIRNFLPTAQSMRWFVKIVCANFRKLCYKMTFVTSSYGLQNFNMTRKPIYMKHTPAGTSVKNIYHYMQLVRDEEFQKYDYGFWQNVMKYDSIYPDIYDLKAVKNKVVLIYGEKDWLADTRDVEWIATQLPNVLTSIKVKDYNHLDFVWGLTARDEVYSKIINIARRNV